ncbi:hypothetical protein EMPS_09889 [Entomortierella parvispora]|uniref:NACHT domain-containing protein n=1 Tax=Entomortierella parvispora TaxID=205924 RepID=A0A9P3M111_9FUNG|nr:hypothetical protein EMPS_09889 [Entomortierella parvispora]
MEVSPLYFSKDVTAIRSICRLPDPDELLQSTHQLAYCLALLQNDVQDDELSPEEIKWRRSAWDEKDYLETMTAQIIRNFAADTLKDSATVDEVVQLVPVLDRDNFRVLLTAFVGTVNQSETLHLPSLDGLTKVILGAAPGFIDSDDLVAILRSLHRRLQYTYPTIRHYHHLLLAISRVLDAMLDVNIRGIDRSIHGPLTDLLREFKSNKDPYVIYQAECAAQALLYMPDNESIWRPGEGGTRLLKDAFKAITSCDSHPFALKEAFKSKRAWYRALRVSELLMKTGRLVDFNRIDLEERKEGMAFLGALYRDTSIWDRQKGVDQVIFDVVTNITTNNDTHFEDAWSLLGEFRKQTPMLRAIADLQSPLWATTYHATDLVLYNASGQELDLETCFVNLATTEAPLDQQQHKQDLRAKATGFHRIPKFERVENTNTESLIPLEQLFNERKLRYGHEGVPGRVLVQGPAGIGKTTLCKKIVHAHQQGLWRDLFDVVLWIPLRHLRGSKSRTLEGFFREKVFTAQSIDQGQAELATALAIRAKEGKVLFILDGLDESGEDMEDEGCQVFRTLLTNLIEQQYVLITTRPSGLGCKQLRSVVLELEAAGLSQQNVKDFLVQELGSDAANAAQDFIRKAPWMQGLVNIPLYLHMICHYWSSLRDITSITLTGFYRLMMQNVWSNGALQTPKNVWSNGALQTRKTSLTLQSMGPGMISMMLKRSSPSSNHNSGHGVPTKKSSSGSLGQQLQQQQLEDGSLGIKPRRNWYRVHGSTRKRRQCRDFKFD